MKTKVKTGLGKFDRPGFVGGSGKRNIGITDEVTPAKFCKTAWDSKSKWCPDLGWTDVANPRTQNL
jgi:hypothetical protein